MPTRESRSGGFAVTRERQQDFEAVVAPYRSGKNSVRFPLNQPLPTEVIEAIVRLLHDRTYGEPQQ
jgi:hypothetical protein